MLRAADRSISWHIPDRNDPALKHQGEGSRRLYQQLPGLYESAITELSDNVDLSDDPASTGRFRLLLHEDNTFEYTWKLLRSGKALMKYNLQITGDWSKAVMNRDLLGNEDQHLSLKARKLRFKRSSDYGQWWAPSYSISLFRIDKENKSWNITLKSLTRNGSDWVSTAEVEKENCVPAFIFSFLYKENGSLHSFGSASPHQFLSNSSSCRVLAGLTKRLGNKLGSPLDVMTDQWLPKKSVVLIPTRRIGGSPAREFNPYRWYVRPVIASKFRHISPYL